MVRKRQRCIKRYGKYQTMAEDNPVLQDLYYYYYGTKAYQFMAWEREGISFVIYMEKEVCGCI